uniref:THD domain-containing protein n=1 Tax=Oryzias latipes TaxID=8090 RepID=A0A3P9HFT7_ORYLA
MEQPPPKLAKPPSGTESHPSSKGESLFCYVTYNQIQTLLEVGLVKSNQTSGDPLEWETELGNAFLGGFNYSDGNLVVPRDGFYRVFLQVAFEIPDECENQALSCTVLALSEDYPKYKEILKTDDFAECCNCIKTLYTSALFSFKENTMLKVKTNGPYIISKDEKLVFFGAELLPD